MLCVGMEDTYPQHRTGFTCIMCRGIAVVENEGIYMCAPHALEAMSDDPIMECDVPDLPRVLSCANPVGLALGGEVRSAGSAFCRDHPVPLRCRPLVRHRRTLTHSMH